MKIKEGLESEYLAYKAKNTDPYGNGVVTYTERWAELMEAKMLEGLDISVIAKEASHAADTKGITGFMYGCAVQSLSRFWIHGEAIRRWSNLDIQIGSEGDRANESGGVLNPALLVIG